MVGSGPDHIENVYFKQHKAFGKEVSTQICKQNKTDINLNLTGIFYTPDFFFFNFSKCVIKAHDCKKLSCSVYKKHIWGWCLLDEVLHFFIISVWSLSIYMFLLIFQNTNKQRNQSHRLRHKHTYEHQHLHPLFRSVNTIWYGLAHQTPLLITTSVSYGVVTLYR